ncbi:conjugal transfer protein TraB [Agrobacterium rhizogenes]|nr:MULTISPECIES: conjugal transfer protein TraB [Hyphomicrobiales]MCZ7497370.1 conjugal transfer protein TraB [Rhizobium rhizogenes]MCZ7501863.1 conjugal transfer protein TraB [Rhizobium rhizogenes]
MPDRPGDRPWDRWRSAVLVVASVACGAIGWSGHVLLLPVAILFPALWAMAPSRATAALVATGYFLAASRGLPQGVANFYAADLSPGLLLWLIASASFVVVHTVLWTKPRDEAASGRQAADAARAARYLLALALMGLPPFGITGWAHPLTAAGVLFPAWGWWGLAATVAGLAMMTSRGRLAAALVLGGFWAWSAATWTAPRLPEGWRGVDLELGETLGRDTSFARHRVLITTVLRNAHRDDRVIVLPESAFGFWTPTVERLWREALRGHDITVIAGAAVIEHQGYDNVIVAVSADGAGVLYRERMPVPGSMWQPWREWTGQGGGVRAHVFGNPVVEIGDERIAPLICYEQLLLWPVLQSILHAPAVIVATGNGWWTKGTSIVSIQKASVIAWGKLFDIPVVMAFNT